MKNLADGVTFQHWRVRHQIPDKLPVRLVAAPLYCSPPPIARANTSLR